MKFSIGIPAYKGKFLKKCIDSILNQDYVDFELIIINDASPENLDIIVSQYEDDRIKYFVNETNYGAENVVDNWNKCLYKASGEYFILMGDDDELMPNYLSCFLELINRFPDLNVYHCRTFLIDENSTVIGATPSWPEKETVYENMWHRINGLRSQYISDFVYKRSFLISIDGFFKLPLAWASDDITSFLAAKENGIAHTQNVLFRYRVSNITISNSGSVDLKIKAIDEEEKWFHLFFKDINIISDYDKYYIESITKDLKKYFLSKKVETIAYSGIRMNHILSDLAHYCFNRKKIGLNFKHIFYALILAVKKYKSS